MRLKPTSVTLPHTSASEPQTTGNKIMPRILNNTSKPAFTKATIAAALLDNEAFDNRRTLLSTLAALPNIEASDIAAASEFADDDLLAYIVAYADPTAPVHPNNAAFDPSTVTPFVPAETVPDAANAKTSAREAAAAQRIIAHRAAAAAVSAFYSGASKPFKATGDTFQPLNFGNAKPGPNGLGTPRQAALLLAMLTYNAGNIQRDGTFTRGAFSVPATLVYSPDDMRANNIPADAMLAAQPESGCLGNMLGRTVAFIDGPRAGAAQRTQTLRINVNVARAELQHFFGDTGARLLDAVTAVAAS